MEKMNLGAVLMGGDKVEVKPTTLIKRKKEGEEDTLFAISHRKTSHPMVSHQILMQEK